MVIPPEPLPADPIPKPTTHISPHQMAFQTDTKTALSARPPAFLVEMCVEVLGNDSGHYVDHKATALVNLLQDKVCFHFF